MHPRRLLCTALLALGFLPGAAAAQDWRTWYFPYLASSANDFPMYSARLNIIQREPDYFSPLPNRAILTVDAGATTRGSRRAMVRFKAPGLWKGWRFAGALAAEREARFGYYGLGNDTEFDEDLATDAQPFLYRVRRTRYRAYGEVTRWLVPHLGLAVAGGIEKTRFTDLPGPSIFTSSYGSELEDDDATGRATLVYDSRDNEFDTQRGLLLEAGVLGGTGGDGYSRVHAILRGYIPVREGTILAARLGGASLAGSPPLNALFELPVWEDELSALGGITTFRALDEGRFAGRGTLFANVEVRHHILDAGGYGGLTAIGFLDAGRVFDSNDFTLTTEDMKVGGGVGLALRILRSTIFTFNLGRGPDGTEFTVGSGWMF